ncbi:MAG: transporter [Candidatus Acidiferrales bacterium]
MKLLRILAIVIFLCCPPVAVAQDVFLSSWEERVRTTVAEQPGWAVPVVTPSSGLIQLFRSDFVRQITSSETTTWNYGNSKGFDVIPWYKTELDIAVPPYIQHNSAAEDGFGDMAMLLKYRLASANEQRGNYSLSVSIGGTIPTGSYENGSLAATLVPSLFGGKGFSKFDVQSSVSMTLPTGDTAKLGRPVAWNVVGQYKITKIFWPEIENNATFFHGGPNSGKVQSFVTPGLVVSKIALTHDSKSRLGLAFGAGMQIATLQYHAYNHGLILTSRVVF